jgi:hypothetical protein
MSKLPLCAILSRRHDIDCMIYDIHNELDACKKDIQYITNLLLEREQQLSGLEKQLEERETLLHDCNLLIEKRKTQIIQDKMYEQKILYSIRCQQYLLKFSGFHYHFQEMCCDEIISTAHKLHFLQCLKRWNPLITNLPRNENEFDDFEKHYNFKDNIYLTPSLFIHISTWSQITEYNNPLPFTIDSDMSALNLEMHHRLNPSFEISWTITS